MEAIAPMDATYDIHEMNTEESVISRLSDSFNLEEIDAAPDLLFSEVIWKTVRGLDSEMPAPVRAAFILQQSEDEVEEKDLWTFAFLTTKIIHCGE